MKPEIVKKPNPTGHEIERKWIVNTEIGVVEVIIGNSGGVTTRSHCRPWSPGYARSHSAAVRLVKADM